MKRRLTIGIALIAWCVASSVLAQSNAPARAAQPTRPLVFLSEGWKALSTPPDDHGAWPASQSGVASANLTKIDEIGFADLMPGSGHGPGGYVNVGRIEVYGDAVKR